uniref:Uncharacterized protein n=1 Tax=Anopheles darlingi TaxID=43151 RepID=A0A2M4D0S4_ANODA
MRQCLGSILPCSPTRELRAWFLVSILPVAGSVCVVVRSLFLCLGVASVTDRRICGCVFAVSPVCVIVT